MPDVVQHRLAQRILLRRRQEHSISDGQDASHQLQTETHNITFGARVKAPVRGLSSWPG